VALVHRGVDVWHGHVRADLIQPIVVGHIGGSWAGQAQNCGSQAAGDNCGQSELLHFLCLFPTLYFPDWFN
jgi:hypothetical protein